MIFSYGAFPWAKSGNTKGGSITVPLTSCLTGLESAVWQLTIFVFIFETDYSKLVKQEVNVIVILPPLVFPGKVNITDCKNASLRCNRSCKWVLSRRRWLMLSLNLDFSVWKVSFTTFSNFSLRHFFTVNGTSNKLRS